MLLDLLLLQILNLFLLLLDDLAQIRDLIILLLVVQRDWLLKSTAGGNGLIGGGPREPAKTAIL